MNIRNLFLVTSLLSFSLVTVAMDDNQIEITEKCAQDLQDINYDGTALRIYFGSAFSGMSEVGMSVQKEKPSDLVSFLFNEGGVEKAVQPRYMNASSYFTEIIRPQLRELDKCAMELKDEPLPWTSLHSYFNEQIIKKSFVALKEKRVAQDQEELKRARERMSSKDNK